MDVNDVPLYSVTTYIIIRNLKVKYFTLTSLLLMRSTVNLIWLLF